MNLYAPGTPVEWIVARAAGLVAFALLTLAVTLGLLMSTRLLPPRRQKALLGWHETLIWAGLGMLVLHGGALVLDPVMRFSLPAVLVPGVAPWRPLTVAAGIVTGWLMLLLAISFHVRSRIGPRRWRLLHYTSFAAFSIGLWHALTAGSDLIDTRGLLFAVLLGAGIVWLTFARILMPKAPRPGVRARPASAPLRAAPPGPTESGAVTP